MGCNCRWTEGVIAVVVFVVSVWPNLLGAVVSMWVAAIAAVVLILHALMCKNCGACKNCMPGEKEGMAMTKKTPAKKKRR